MTKNLKKYDVFVYILAILLLILIASFFPSTETTHSPETTLAAPTNSDNWQDNASYRDTSWSGSGTSGSPYLITSAQELAGLAYRVNSGTNYSGRYFRQTRDIDLSAHYWTAIGDFENGRSFLGNYNGDGHKITGLFINSGSFQGLFGYIGNSSSASIHDLAIVDSSIQGDDYLGAIVGYIENGTISNCYNAGTVSGYSSIAGIAGSNISATIRNCYNTGNISGDVLVAGIVGEGGNSGGTVANCYNTARISGDAGIGGIIGYNMGRVYSCFNTGAVSGNSAGGVIGETEVSTNSNCYFGGSCTLSYGIGYNANGSTSNTGCTRISSLNSTSYAKREGWYTTTSNWNSSYRWDFTNTWGINSSVNDGYPYLKALTEYTILYDYGDGSAGSSSPSIGLIDVTLNISNPIPERGYYFAGWSASGLNTSTAQYGSSSSSLSSWVSGSIRVTSTYFRNLASPGDTVTLSANWREVHYNALVNYNDGVTPNRLINDIPYSVAASIDYPTREGYNFIDLSLEPSYSYAMIMYYTDPLNAIYFGNLTDVNGRTVTLTVNWDPINYTIAFDLDGGTLSDTFSSYTIESDLTLPEPTKTGYTFTGWYCSSSDGNWQAGTTYPAGTSLNGKYGNISLRATWRANTYTLTFDPQGGSVSPTSIQVTYDQPYGYHNGGVLPTPTRQDFCFNGWRTQVGGTSELDRYATDIYTIAGDSTLYARWINTWNIYTEKPEGNGTTASPYLIATPENLSWISYEVSRGRETTAVCKQTANIDLRVDRDGSVGYWYPIGTQTYPFRGSYDGNGFNIELIQIINLYRNNVGIFGYTNGARIDKIYVIYTGSDLSDDDHVSMSTYRNTNIAGIIAYAQGSTILSNSAFYGQLATTVNMTNTGALIGYAANTVTIRDCVIFDAINRYGDGSSVGVSGGNPRIESCVYKINGAKGYTFTGYSDSTETNYVIVDYLSVPVPAGLSWLAFGGERATLAEIKAWANS